MKYGFAPCPRQRWCEAIHGAIGALAATERSSIEIARWIQRQRTLRYLPIVAFLECVEHTFRPTAIRVWRSFEYRSCPSQAAPSGCTGRIPSLVKNNWPPGIGAIAAPAVKSSLKRIQHRFRPPKAPLVRGQLVNRTCPNRAAAAEGSSV